MPALGIQRTSQVPLSELSDAHLVQDCFHKLFANQRLHQEVPNGLVGLPSEGEILFRKARQQEQEVSIASVAEAGLHHACEELQATQSSCHVMPLCF